MTAPPDRPAPISSLMIGQAKKMLKPSGAYCSLEKKRQRDVCALIV